MPKNLVDQFGNPILGSVRTHTYRPTDLRYFTAIRDLPPLSITTVEVMRKDSMIKLCLGILQAPIQKMELAYQEGGTWKNGVLADDAIVGEFVKRQFSKLWDYAHHICRSQVYGWCGAEVTLAVNEESDTIEVDCVYPRHSRDVKALVQGGELVGIRFERLNMEVGGHVDIGFPRCFFLTHDPQPGVYYGTTVMEGAYSPWWDKWMRGGALDVRRLFMFKDAYGGMDMTYPVKIYDLGDGTTISSKDIARQVVEQSQAGAVTTRPYDPDEKTGKNMWEMERASIPNNPQHILEYPKQLDDEIRHGMGVNDDVITADSTGSWNGKGMSFFAFMSTRDEWCRHLIRQLDEQIVRPLVELNFGKDVFYEVSHKPFAEQMKDQLGQSPQQQGGGMLQNRLPMDRDGDGFFNEAGSDLEPDGALRMSYAAIGRGAMEARRLIELGGEVRRMANDGSSRWITIGGEKNSDGTRDGGFPVLIDKDGKILRSGGPQGVLGKRVGDLKSEHFKEDYSGDDDVKKKREAKYEGIKPGSRNEQIAKELEHDGNLSKSKETGLWLGPGGISGKTAGDVVRAYLQGNKKYKTAIEQRNELMADIEKMRQQHPGYTPTKLIDKLKSLEDRVKNIHGDDDSQEPPSDEGGSAPKPPKKPKTLAPADRKWNATVKAKAEEWGITPGAYQEIADQVWKDKQQLHHDREKAKEYARKLTGLTKGDIDRLEGQGFDYSSRKHAKTKQLDVWGQSIARSYGLWDADDPNIDHAEKLWELLKEGKRSIPARGSSEYVKAVDEFLADQMRDFDFDSQQQPEEIDEGWLSRFSVVTRMSLISAAKKRRYET